MFLNQKPTGEAKPGCRKVHLSTQSAVASSRTERIAVRSISMEKSLESRVVSGSRPPAARSFRRRIRTHKISLMLGRYSTAIRATFSRPSNIAE